MDESRPLVVSSCGEYRMKKLPVFITTRPNGRFDYQLLYVAAGKAHFQLEGQDRVYPAGTMVLYRPGEAQEYRYYLEDQPQIFWVHFSGSEVESLLRQYGIGANGPAFSVGLLPEYKRLFRQIIQELQLTKPLFEDLLSTTLMNIFILAGRQQSQDSGLPTVLQAEMEEAIHYFHEHFNQNISIEKYAQGWRFERISLVASAIMRVAMFEILYMPEIPNGAAINEAVELTKRYDEPETVKFVNGILGSFLREEVKA